MTHIASWQRAPGLETWRVQRNMVIIEPEGPAILPPRNRVRACRAEAWYRMRTSATGRLTRSMKHQPTIASVCWADGFSVCR